MPEHMAWGADCAPTCNCSAKCPHAVHDCEAGLPLYLAVLSGQVSFSGDTVFSVVRGHPIYIPYSSPSSGACITAEPPCLLSSGSLPSVFLPNAHRKVRVFLANTQLCVNSTALTCMCPL